MSTDQIRDALDALRWTPGQVAVWCGYTRATGYAWTSGRTTTPAHVAAWLEDRMDGRLVDPPARRTRPASAAPVPPGSAF